VIMDASSGLTMDLALQTAHYNAELQDLPFYCATKVDWSTWALQQLGQSVWMGRLWLGNGGLDLDLELHWVWRTSYELVTFLDLHTGWARLEHG
jgi:hypothetical protein